MRMRPLRSPPAASGQCDTSDVTSLPIDDDAHELLTDVLEVAHRYLGGLADRLVRDPGIMAAVDAFSEPLPEHGAGAAETISLLGEHGMRAAAHSAGPRFFHFVVGGVTPAALGADWVTSLVDQNAYAWTSSPLASELERLVIRWLLDLFDLPSHLGGVLTTGTTMSNFTALAAAREWWGGRYGIDVSEDGLGHGLPTVVAGGHIHPSAIKALGMLGIGRGRVERFAADAIGSTDLEGMARRLREIDGPVILIATAGEPNAGLFDPVDAMADLADAHDGWLHVDAAFGAFARLSPKTRNLTKGFERADSIAVDGHKWLNVPYESGVVFVRDVAHLGRAFTHSAEYLPDPEDPRPNFGFLGPEMSRRARAIPIWASLRAYGRDGYTRMVESCMERARHMGEIVAAAPDMELLSDVILNIVCFRYRPDVEMAERDLDDLNRAIGDALLADGRVYAGTTVFDGKAALRPAVANWRTTDRDVELLIDVVRELGSSIHPG